MRQEHSPNSGTATFYRLTDSLRERARLPHGDHIDRAVLKAAGVVDAKGPSRIDRMNDLLAYLLDEFPASPSAMDVHDVVIRADVDTQPIRESVVPVLLMVELLAGQKLRMDLSRCTNWFPFVERHGMAVMAA